MHTQKHSLDFIQSQLSFLPQDTVHKILKHLRQTIKYEPVIGIMGKSGSGKSSLCNALFQSEICNTHPLEGCTRDAQRLTLTIKERRMTIIDLPGVGETPEYDREYHSLYRQLLPELDLIIWVLRSDERAYAADIEVHRFLLAQGADPSRFLFVLNRADSVYPASEWDHQNLLPSQQQRLSLAAISAKVAGLFPSSFPIQPVSAISGWNLHEFVTLMIHALPARATSAVFTHFRQENCSAQTRQHAKEGFAEAIRNSFDEAVSTKELPSWLMLLLHQAKRKIVALLVSLWSSFF